MQLLENKKTPIVTIDQNDLSQYIDPQLPRYQHIIGVVRCMENLFPKLKVAEEWKPLLLQACYLHDIGYSSQLNKYNYHQLDGAIFAHAKGFPKPVIATVLFHSCAYEDALASRPDLVDIYQQNFALIDEVDQMFIDLVSYCDLHTSATGNRTTLKERVDDVAVRYGENHEVSKLMSANLPRFKKIIAKVSQTLLKNP